jgi:hypothetical protein
MHLAKWLLPLSGTVAAALLILDGVGFCFHRGRFMTDDDYIEAAGEYLFSHVMTKSPTGVDVSGYGDIATLRSAVPECCFVYDRSVFGMIGRRVYINFWATDPHDIGVTTDGWFFDISKCADRVWRGTEGD